MQHRILIVDDHPIVLQAMQATLRDRYPRVEVLTAKSVAQARETLKARANIHLVLLDLAMPGVRGLEGLIEIRSNHPSIPVLVISGLDDPRVTHGVLAAGAAGFVSKAATKSDILDAIQTVLDGGTYDPAHLGEANSPPPIDPNAHVAQRVALLTRRQLRVLQMIREGKLNKQIAYELGVGETTVKAHVSEILRKLGVSSRTQAVVELSALDFDRLIAEQS